MAAASTLDRSLLDRAERFAALGDPARLAIIDELAASDRAPSELQAALGLASNLLAHHLQVLETVGLVVRRRSSGDGRRRYVHLVRAVPDERIPTRRVTASRVMFVCTHNSARSPLAAALWQRRTGGVANSAGTHPAPHVHPGALATARRAGLDLTGVVPVHLATSTEAELVVTVCDNAHEELGAPEGWLHWSIPDPVADGSSRAFNTARDELRDRIESLAQLTALRG